MAAILLDSTVVVVRTRPRAIPLAMITMGFLLFPIWVWGSAWWPFGLPELRYKFRESIEIFEETFKHSASLASNFWPYTLKMQRTLNLKSFLLLHIRNEASFKGELSLVHTRRQRTPPFGQHQEQRPLGRSNFCEYAQRIRLKNQICRIYQNDEKLVNRGLPVLDLPRGHVFWCWPKTCD